MSNLAHLLVYYDGLDDIPVTRRGPAHTEWEDLRCAADGVAIVASGE